MVGGGLMQLVAYGAQDMYLSGAPQISFWKTTYKRYTNFTVEQISNRKYINFEILFDDKTTTKEIYYDNDSIVIYSLDLNILNNNKILVNSKKVIKENKDKLNEIIKKEEIEQKRKQRHESTKDGSKFFSFNYKDINAAGRAQRKTHNKQMKNQFKNQIKRR